ncbi:hypothetical protein BdWA1_003101 [Babesia duncani]|uniref:Uncharacterized protein n=1 Tax=Babesia duncani TaxID=323732 RepID=A0AAD9PIE5_9APIC|nr:hypothetical protein BdWA1_003101 [Babesia duncani]
MATLDSLAITKLIDPSPPASIRITRIDENCPIHGRNKISTNPQDIGDPEDLIKFDSFPEDTAIDTKTQSSLVFESLQQNSMSFNCCQDENNFQNLYLDNPLESNPIDANVPETRPNGDLYKLENCSEPNGAGANVDLLEFELAKSHKILESQAKLIRERDETIATLMENVHELERWRDALEPHYKVLKEQQQSLVESSTRVNVQQLEQGLQENKILGAKLSELESSLTEKDKVIAAMYDESFQNKLALEKLQREMDQLRSDRKQLYDSMAVLNSSLKSREMKIQLLVAKEHQQELNLVSQELDEARGVVKKQNEEITKCQNLLAMAQGQVSHMYKELEAKEEIIKERSMQIQQWKSRLIALEGKLTENDKSSRLLVALETQSRLRKKCNELQVQLYNKKGKSP